MQVSDENFILAIACNKSDLESERVVSKSRAEVFAAKNDAILFETSAKENIGVEEIFKRISEEVRDDSLLIFFMMCCNLTTL